MSGFSRSIISRLYDFIECNLLKDYQKTLDAIGQFINFNGRETLVDVGGGTGYIIDQIHENVSDVINIDISNQMLQQQKNSSLHLIQASGLNIPIKNKTIDLILLINTLHHIDKNKHQKLFNEIFRILKDNGVLLIVDLYYPMTFLNKIFTLFEEFAVGKTYHISSKEVKSLLQIVGFNMINIYYLDKRKWQYCIKVIK